jgi:glycosyltransferase involved in cell wall biosynthesis
MAKSATSEEPLCKGRMVIQETKPCRGFFRGARFDGDSGRARAPNASSRDRSCDSVRLRQRSSPLLASLPGGSRPWVVMLLENEPYPADVRVRNEADTLVAAGYRVTVLAPRGKGQSRRELVEGVDVVRFWLPTTPQSAFGFLLEYAIAHLQLARLALASLLAGADIVHANNPPDTLGVLLVLARLLGRRTVFDNHDLFPDLFAVRYRSPLLTRLLRVFQHISFWAADLVLTTNESQREIVLEAVSKDPESVVVVRNGPRLQGISQVGAAPQAQASAKRASVEILYLGALEPQDGVVTLAPVLHALVQNHGLDARLTVVGAGSSRTELERSCAHLGLSERVLFTGRVPHARVPLLLEGADICVDTAPCNELNHRSTMIKIAEYMAAGKPIVAFDLLETKRTAAGAAVYAPCGDVEGFAARIAQLEASPELCREMSLQAEERLPQLSWERSAQALLAGYGQLLQAGA